MKFEKAMLRLIEEIEQYNSCFSCVKFMFMDSVNQCLEIVNAARIPNTNSWKYCVKYRSDETVEIGIDICKSED